MLVCGRRLQIKRVFAIFAYFFARRRTWRGLAKGQTKDVAVLSEKPVEESSTRGFSTKDFAKTFRYTFRKKLGFGWKSALVGESGGKMAGKVPSSVFSAPKWG